MRKVILPAVFAVLLFPGSALAVSGGQPVTDAAVAPWVATLAVTGDAPLLQRAGCGGALVAPDRVLTAAHCVDGTDPSATEVHVNARVLSGDPGVVRRVRGISMLPSYEILPSPVDPENPNWASARGDLAVVFLDRPVREVRPVPVAAARPRAGATVTLFSHGTTGRPGEWRNDVLNRADLTVLDDAGCRAATPAVVDRRSVACAEGAAAACYLDSGSPLVSDGRLVGVFSFAGETAGRECQRFPMYFADAAGHRWWVAAPVLPPQPYPMGPVTVSGTPSVGQTLRCVAPPWRTRPATVSFRWVSVVWQGPYPVPTPIEGATGAELPLGADLAGRQVACAVTASSVGGTSQVLSAAVPVTA